MTIVDEALLENFRKGPCERCGKKGRTDPHHVFCKGIGGGRRLDVRINLISLCRLCHRLFHDGKIGRDELLALVAGREKVTMAAITETIFALRRRRK